MIKVQNYFFDISVYRIAMILAAKNASKPSKKALVNIKNSTVDKVVNCIQIFLSRIFHLSIKLNYFVLSYKKI